MGSRLRNDAVTRLSADLARAAIHAVPLALYVFRDTRLAYANKAGVALTARLSRQHGIEMSVLLQSRCGTWPLIRVSLTPSSC